MPTTRVSARRLVANNQAALASLRLLADLPGTWEGEGFNLIARPDFHDHANLYLQLNQTQETLAISQIGSPIPNRGFGQDDIELFGLSYVQKIHDRHTGGALHLEPGLWITQPGTTYPLEGESPQAIARMGSIPHGNALLAQGTATSFTGAPTLANGTVPYAFSAFPSFNSTPFAAAQPVINAAGSSEKLTAAQIPGALPFHEYDLDFGADGNNPRTPFDTSPAEPKLPAEIEEVAMQDLVNDPARLLQAVISKQVAHGHTFRGVALNIATQAAVSFRTAPNDPTGPAASVSVTDGGGGIENIPFLDGGEPAGTQGPNAQTALVYATFWIEHVTPPEGHEFLQLQYAQMTVLNFGIFSALHPPAGGPAPALVILGWPHISVATLRKAFN